MFAQITTVAFVGIEARPVDVQVQISPGLPAFNIVGLADKAVAESRERVRGALNAIGLGLPPKRITINLAPADLPKEGSHYDLPIALGLLAASGAISPEQIEDYCAIGELSLDGAISHVVGALPAAMGANGLHKGLICPKTCGAEAAWASDTMALLAPPHLLALINHFKGTQSLPRPKPGIARTDSAMPDMKDVKGQETAKRVLEIAAAGGHNVLMVGPPGSGKSMLAARMPSILPPLSSGEMLEVSMIRSMAGELGASELGGEIGAQNASGGLTNRRPFRAPHHSASMAALVGGGARPRPGEVALAHLGVLFLDELPEFSPQVLDSLRQPIESGETVIARANHRITYPSRIQLIAAMNPCRCGRAGEPGYSCPSGKSCAAKYQARISGPLLDRIDLKIEVPAVTAADLLLPSAQETSADIAARVGAARALQEARLNTITSQQSDSAKLKASSRTNAACSGALLEEIAVLDEQGRKLLIDAAQKMQLSARGYHRCLRVARTLADMENSTSIRAPHLAEALSYRTELASQAAAA